MGWDDLIDALDELETEVEYDGYFCSIQDAVIIVMLASMCELKSVMRIHSWATTATVSKFLAKAFGIKQIPCYCWLLELLALIKPDSLNRCMMKFVASLCPELIGELEKRDGEAGSKEKTSCYGVFGWKNNPLQIGIVNKSAVLKHLKLRLLTSIF